MNSPSLDGSVTIWLEQLIAGDPSAAGPLWKRYYSRLVALARGRIRSRQCAAEDEEDVALSAFDSFCRGVENGRFPRLDDRDDLWQVLFVITTRKAIGLMRKEMCAKRLPGSFQVIHASAVRGDANSAVDVFGGMAGSEPSPEFAAQVAEECQRLLSSLGDGQLRQIAIWKMEGFTNAEIAAKISRSIPAVERKLARIRTLWERERPE